MHDGAVGAGAGDGVEATGRAACRSPGASPAAGRTPRSRAACRSWIRAPSQPRKRAHRRAVAAMGARGCPRARPRSCRPWAAPPDRRRAPASRRPPAGASPPRTARSRSRSARACPTLPSMSSAAPSSSGGARVTALPSQATVRVGHLAAVHVEVDMAVAVQQREAQRERRARHVAAAHVEQPGDRIGRGQQRHVGALAPRRCRRCACGAARWSRRRTRPDAAAPARAAAAGRSVHTVSIGFWLDRHEAAAGALRGAREAVVAVDRLQPGIEAELAALRQVLGDPGLGRFLRDLVRHEGVGVDLARAPPACSGRR